MEQLFSNIVSNAIKFHKPGTPPVIHIASSELTEAEKRTFKLPLAADYYRIAISDNGIGFEDEYRERIFQVFQRLHGKSEYPGSGIGLAICKRIADYHHGIIFADNIPGTGARFTFILPRLQKEQNTNEPDKK
jgi:signal transduction histidine kinase